MPYLFEANRPAADCILVPRTSSFRRACARFCCCECRLMLGNSSISLVSLPGCCGYALAVFCMPATCVIKIPHPKNTRGPCSPQASATLSRCLLFSSDERVRHLSELSGQLWDSECSSPFQPGFQAGQLLLVLLVLYSPRPYHPALRGAPADPQTLLLLSGPPQISTRSSAAPGPPGCPDAGRAWPFARQKRQDDIPEIVVKYGSWGSICASYL